MTTNSQLSTTEPKNNKIKNEPSKQLEQEQNHRNRDHREGYQWGMGGQRMGEKAQGIRNINSRYNINRQGEIKNSMENGEAKKLVCMTH